MEKIKIAGWPAQLYTYIVWFNRWLLDKEYIKPTSTDSCTIGKNILLFIGLVYVAYLIVFSWFFDQLFQLINAFSSPEFRNAVLFVTSILAIIAVIFIVVFLLFKTGDFIANKIKIQKSENYFKESDNEDIFIQKNSKTEDMKEKAKKFYDSYKNDYCLPVEIQTEVKGDTDEKSTK